MSADRSGRQVRKVLAIIVDYDGREDAERLTCELAEGRGTGPELTVLHVDNGNREASSLSVRQQAAGVRLLRLEENRGYSAGLNAGVRSEAQAGREYDAYWFLNPDLEVAPDALSRLVALLNAHPEAGAVGPEVRLGRSDRNWGTRGVISPWTGGTAMTSWPEASELPRWSYIPGCSLLARAEAYQDAHGMPERYFLYYEEVHFCVELQKSGWKLWVDPEALVFHRVHSMEKGIPARHFAFYFARNNLYFWKTCFGIPVWVQWPRAIGVALKELILPLRRAPSSKEALERLRYIVSGLADGPALFKNDTTPRERQLFGR